MIETAGGLLTIVLRFVAVTAMTGTIGAWVFYRFVLPRLGEQVGAEVIAQWRTLAIRTVVACAALVAAVAAARFVLPSAGTQSAAAGFGPQALLAQCVIAGLTTLLWGATWGSPRFPQIARDGIVVLLAFTPPLLAHAGTATEMRAASFVVDIAHGLSAGAWIGALALVTLVVARARGTTHQVAHISALFGPFHRVAVIAAPVVFVTGLATAWLRMGVPEGIANPTYSGLFVAKLLLAGVAGYFGAGHSKLAAKKGAAIDARAVERTLAAEVGFAVTVFVLTALLLGTPPIG